MNNEFGKHLKIILTEMCNRVNANYDDIDFKQHDWYYTYSWTKEEEKEFISWLARYLYNNKEARLELLNNSIRKVIYKCNLYAMTFAFNYGWKFKE